MSPRGTRTGAWVTVLVLVIGALIGGAVGEALSDIAPIFARSAGVGFSLDEFSLGNVITGHLGLRVSVNLATAIGLVIAAWIIR